MGSSPGRVILKTLKMVLTAFLSGARRKRMEWKFEHTELPVDKPSAVVFTASADVWPRATKNRDRHRPMRHWRGKDFDCFDNDIAI